MLRERGKMPQDFIEEEELDQVDDILLRLYNLIFMTKQTNQNGYLHLRYTDLRLFVHDQVLENERDYILTILIHIDYNYTNYINKKFSEKRSSHVNNKSHKQIK